MASTVVAANTASGHKRAAPTDEAAPASNKKTCTGGCTVDNFIAGVHVAPAAGQYMNVTNPATGGFCARVAVSDVSDVNAAVTAASNAHRTWGALTVGARARVLFRFRQILVEHREELADMIVQEHGKTRPEAFGSIDKGLETLEWACSMPQLFQGKTLEVSTGVTCADMRESLGVVASIVPFNFPMMVPFWTLPIAVCSGNTFVLKPSEKVPMTMSRVMELAKQAGLPDGVLNIVNGTRAVVEALCDHPTVQAVTFVGSSKVAEMVAKRCRGNNKRVIALGGAKNHMVALTDCNVDMCSTDIVNSFTGCAGQRCMAASVLLTVTKQEELVKAIVAKATRIVPGQGGAGQMGPVIDLEAQQRILRYIKESEEGGATILLDGRSWVANAHSKAAGAGPGGWWIGPTIVVHTNAKDRALHDEIFGPILSILCVDTKERAIEIENASPYGNAACIYTSVGAHAEWFTRRFSVGMVGVNIGVPVPREPFSFGGCNTSKFGGELDITGDGGMEFFTRRKKVTTKWTPPGAAARSTDWMS
jgi:methylmalonic acid semialdehyde dehydrogenase